MNASSFPHKAISNMLICVCPCLLIHWLLVSLRAWVWQEWKQRWRVKTYKPLKIRHFGWTSSNINVFFAKFITAPSCHGGGGILPRCTEGFEHCYNWTSCSAGLIDSFIAEPWLEDEIFTMLYSSSQAVDFCSCNIHLASCAFSCYKRKSKATEWLLKIASSLISFPLDIEESGLCGSSQKSIGPQGVGLCIL